MMKLTVVVVLACFAAVTTSMPQEWKDKIMGVMEECRLKHNVDKDMLMTAIKNRELPKTEDGKCMMACVMKEFEIIKDNKYNADAALAMNKYKFDKPDLVEKADKVVTICKDQVPSGISNECELAMEIAKCCMTEAKKIGLPPPEFE